MDETILEETAARIRRHNNAARERDGRVAEEKRMAETVSRVEHTVDGRTRRNGSCVVSIVTKEWNEYSGSTWYPMRSVGEFKTFEDACEFVIAENAKIEALIAAGELGLAESEKRYTVAMRWQARFAEYVKHRVIEGKE